MAMRWDSRHLTEDELERSYEDVYYPVNDVGGGGEYGMGGVDDLQPPVGDAPSLPPPQPPASVPPPPVTPDQYEKLAGQIKRSWEAGGVGDSIVGVSTQDRANALAQQLAQRGVRDLEKLSVGSIQRYTGVDAREPAGKVVDWSTYRGAPFETYSFLQYDGKPIGYIANSPSDTLVKADPFDKSGAGVLDLWDPAGKGHLKFIPTASGPGGLLSFTPKWASSSDLPGEVVAALGIALTVSGVGAALGSAITSGLGIGASASVNALIGNTVMQTVLNGGDIESAVKGSLASYVGAQVGEFVGKAAGSFFSNPEGIRLISNVANQATRATILGQDVESAIKNTVVAGAVDFATAKIPGFNDLPNAVKDTVKQSINAALQGKDVDVGTMLANAAKEGILSYGLNQIPEFKSADARTQSFISTMLRTALDQGDLTQSAINWAVGQAQQEFQKTIKAGPALDELKKAGLIPEASYFGLDDKMKTLVDQFVQQKDPKAAASTYINSLSTTDEEIRKFYKELTGRDPTDEDKDLLARFTGPLDEATARTGLDNQIRANESADRLRFDELNKVLTNPKATEGDLVNAMSQYGITPAFIERVTGRKYDEIKTDLTPKPPTTTTEPSGTTGTTTTGGDFVEAGSGVTGTTGATTGAATGAGEFSYGNLNIKHENQRKAAEIIRQELGDAVFSDPKFVDYLNQGGLNAAAGNVFAGSENHLRDQLRLMKSGQQVSLGLPKDALTRQLAAGYDIGNYKAPPGFFVAEPGEALADIGYTEAGVPVNLGQRVEVTGKYLPTAGGELSKNIMDAVKGTWLEAPSAMGLGAVGELGQAFSGGASWFFNLPPSHSLNRTFNEINAAAETGVPQDVKDQWKNWQNNVGKAEGFWGTIWAGMKNAPDNFKGILWETGKEILQELPMLGAGLLVRGTAAGLALAEKVAARLGVGVATALEMIENGGAAYNDAMGETLKRLDPLVKEGKITREEQLYMAHNNAGQAFLSGAGITGVISRVPGGNSLIEQIVGASRLTGAANLAQAINTAVSTGAKSSIKEFFSEGIESGLTSASTQYAVTGKVNPQQAAYDAITGAIIGKFTTGTLSTLDSLKSNLETAYSGQSRDTVIGINPSTGQDITLGQTLQALDTKRQELGGKVEPPLGDVEAGTTSGADTTAGAAAGAGTTTGGTTAGTTAGTTTGAGTTVGTGGTTVGTGGTTTGGTTAPVGIDGDIMIGGGGDRGAVTADTGAATGTTVGVATDTSEQAAAAFDPKTLFAGYTDPGDPNAFGRQDIEQLITLGATPEQIRSIANEFSSRGMPVGPAAQNWLATGSFEAASAAGTTAGETTTAGTGAATTTGGAETTVGGTTTTGTTAGTTTGTTAGTTTGATTGTATAGTAGGTTVAGLTQDDVLDIVNSVFAKNPTLSIDQVKSVVESTIAANPGLKMADVNQAITNALSGLPASVSPTQMQDAINNAVTSITSGQITSADVTNIVNNALAANPGLKIADVQSVVNQAIAGLPAGLSMADVNTAISNALKTLPATVSPAGMKSAIDAAVADIRGSQLTQADVTTIVNNALAANPGLKVADVQAVVNSAIAGLPAGLSTADVNTAITNALSNLPASVTPGDMQTAINAAVADIRGSQLTQSDVTNIVNNALAANPGLKIADVQTVVNSAIAGLPAGLSMADVNTAITNALKTLPASVTPGEMQTAINTAVSGLGTSVAGQIGDLKNSLTAALNDAKAQGLQGDAALQAGIDAVAASLGTTKSDLLSRLGTTEQGLRTEFASQIGGVQTQVTQLGDSLRSAIAEARAAGLQGDSALQAGLDKVAADLGTTKDSLLSQLGTTEQALRADFASQLGGVQTQVTQLGDSLRDAIADARASGLQGDAALQAGLDKVAADLGTTRGDLLAQMGTTEQALRSEFSTQIGGVQTQVSELGDSLRAAIAEARSAGLEGDAALQVGLDSLAERLGTTRSDLLSTLGATEQSLRTEFASQLGGVQTQVSQLGDSLRSAIEAARASGLQGDAALQAGIDKVAGDLGTTRESLLSQLGTTEQALRSDFAAQLGTATGALAGQIGDVETRLLDKINAAQQSGLKGDAALQSAIDGVAADLGTTKDALLGQIGQTEQSLRTQFQTALGGVQTQVQQQATSLANLDARIDTLMQQGLDARTATQTALNELGQTQQQTSQQLNQRIDTLTQQGMDTQAATQQAINELSQTQTQSNTQLNQRIDALVQQGLDIQTATQQAINELSQTQQQTTSRIDQRIDQLMQQGMTQNAATQQAINELGTQVTTTQTQTQTALQDVNTRINQLMQQGVDYQTATRTAIDELGGGLGELGRGFQSYVTSQEQQREQDRAAQQQAQQRAQSQQGMQQALTALGVGAAAAPVADYYAKFKDPFMTRVTDQKFVSPLESYLQEVKSPAGFDGAFGTDTTKQPDRVQQEENPMDYFNYGKVQSVDDLLKLGSGETESLFSFKEGGIVPAYFGGGLAGYAGGGALNVVNFAGKPRIDFRHGSAVHGPGDGQSDDIPAMLADGEYVFDAETVSALGNGSTKAGAEALDKMRLAIRRHKRSGPIDSIPPESKSPLEYLAMGNKKGKK